LIYAIERAVDIIHTKAQIFIVEARLMCDLYQSPWDIARYLSTASKPRVNTEVVHDMK